MAVLWCAYPQSVGTVAYFMLQMSTLFLHVNCGLSVEILGFHAKMFSNRRQVCLSDDKQAKSRVKHTNCSNNYSAHCFGESNFITLQVHPWKGRLDIYTCVYLSLQNKLSLINHGVFCFWGWATPKTSCEWINLFVEYFRFLILRTLWVGIQSARLWSRIVFDVLITLFSLLHLVVFRWSF